MLAGGEAERLVEGPRRVVERREAGLGQDTKAGHDSKSGQEAWSRVKRRLRAEVGEDVFSSWLARLEMVAVAEDCARLSVPTRFLKSWIEAHYAERVLSVYRSEDPSVGRISITVRGASRDGQGAPRPPCEMTRRDEPKPAFPGFAEDRAGTPAPIVSPEERGSEIASAPLDARLTFESFVVGRSNALAHAAAERIARHEGGSSLYNPLYLQAGVGLGKTHLMHAIGQEARLAGKRVIYLTADRFMYGFVASLKAQTSLAFKERLRGIDLLILDDVQFIQGKSIQQEFGHTLNALIDAGRQVVVAADRPPADLESLDERVRSRLAGGLVVEIAALDEGLRAGILDRRIAAV
jgi:chromosomal replication initiator protein